MGWTTARSNTRILSISRLPAPPPVFLLSVDWPWTSLHATNHGTLLSPSRVVGRPRPCSPSNDVARLSLLHRSRRHIHRCVRADPRRPGRQQVHVSRSCRPPSRRRRRRSSGRRRPVALAHKQQQKPTPRHNQHTNQNRCNQGHQAPVRGPGQLPRCPPRGHPPRARASDGRVPPARRAARRLARGVDPHGHDGGDQRAAGAQGGARGARGDERVPGPAAHREPGAFFLCRLVLFWGAKGRKKRRGPASVRLLCLSPLEQ